MYKPEHIMTCRLGDDSPSQYGRILSMVFYHKDADGSCSAGLHAVYESFAGLTRDHIKRDTIYIPISYGSEDAVISQTRSMISRFGAYAKLDNIYILDFSFTPAQLEDLFDEASSTAQIIYLDHHATACQTITDCAVMIEETPAYSGLKADIRYGGSSECGASMTYRYFTEKISTLKYMLSDAEFSEVQSIWDNCAKLTAICKDYDLWIHADPSTMPIITGLTQEALSVAEWKELLQGDTDVLQPFLIAGNALLLEQKQYAERIVLSRHTLYDTDPFTGGKLLVLNIIPQWANIVSHTIFEMRAAAAVLCWSVSSSGKVRLSMRSDPKSNPAIDCGNVMKEYFNGGGHANAAGGGCSNISEFLSVLTRYPGANKY